MWFHRCGLVHGDLTPDNFVVLGGTGRGGSATTLSASKGQGLARTGGGGGKEAARGAARWGGDLRLMIGRSVARPSDASGGCPRHPLLEVRCTAPPETRAPSLRREVADCDRLCSFPPCAVVSRSGTRPIIGGSVLP